MSPFNKGEIEKSRIQLILFGGTDECRASDGAETGYLSQFASRTRERMNVFFLHNIQLKHKEYVRKPSTPGVLQTLEAINDRF